MQTHEITSDTARLSTISDVDMMIKVAERCDDDNSTSLYYYYQCTKANKDAFARFQFHVHEIVFRDPYKGMRQLAGWILQDKSSFVTN